MSLCPVDNKRLTGGEFEMFEFAIEVIQVVGVLTCVVILGVFLQLIYRAINGD